MIFNVWIIGIVRAEMTYMKNRNDRYIFDRNPTHVINMLAFYRHLWPETLIIKKINYSEFTVVSAFMHLHRFEVFSIVMCRESYEKPVKTFFLAQKVVSSLLWLLHTKIDRLCLHTCEVSWALVISYKKIKGIYEALTLYNTNIIKLK